ncbi:hypothetical protein Aperf_G00000060279 [Anoplocephala perfoliata]
MCIFSIRGISALKATIPLSHRFLKAWESTTSDSLIPRSISSVPQTEDNDKKVLSILGHEVLYENGLKTRYGDRAYHELPIIHITTTRNNTKITLTDCNGRSLCTTSCGCEGFRNARKQTTVAAQTVGISIGLKAQKLGIKDVRVKMRGLGVNRLSTVSGMTLSGLNVISLTDDTPIHYGMGRRPKKVPKK